MISRTIKGLGLAAVLAMALTALAAASASASSVVTEEATNITPTGATLNGTATPDGKELTCVFHWGTTTSYGNFAGITGVKGTAPPTHLSTPITGLTDGVLYHFRLACLEGGTTMIFGEDRTFTTGPGPEVVTAAATNVGGLQATLNGSVDPNGKATSYWFEYGTTTGYGAKIPISAKEVGSGGSPVNVNQTPTGLTRNTTYNYRIVAQSSVGTSYGANKTFTTLNIPFATTGAATEVTHNSAKLNGTVNAGTLSTQYWFEYGLTTSYGSSTGTGEAIGASDKAVSMNATGLAGSTTYHYRLVAKNAAGTTYGADATFTTAPAPGKAKVTTESATGVTSTEAVLNGTVNPQGSLTGCGFQIGLTTSYGTIIADEQPNFEGFIDTPFSAKATGLLPSTTYHYQAVCGFGETKGLDRTFVTSP